MTRLVDIHQRFRPDCVAVAERHLESPKALAESPSSPQPNDINKTERKQETAENKLLTVK